MQEPCAPKNNGMSKDRSNSKGGSKFRPNQRPILSQSLSFQSRVVPCNSLKKSIDANVDNHRVSTRKCEFPFSPQSITPTTKTGEATSRCTSLASMSHVRCSMVRFRCVSLIIFLENALMIFFFLCLFLYSLENLVPWMQPLATLLLKLPCES